MSTFVRLGVGVHVPGSPAIVVGSTPANLSSLRALYSLHYRLMHDIIYELDTTACGIMLLIKY